MKIEISLTEAKQLFSLLKTCRNSFPDICDELETGIATEEGNAAKLEAIGRRADMLEKERECADPLRCYGRCDRAIKALGSRWYITMGHPGFNSPANNAGGYMTAIRARAAIRRYASR